MAFEYISPSSLKQWETDPEEFFLSRFVRVPKRAQTLPMAIGSCFDIYVKSFIAKEFGIEHPTFLEEFNSNIEVPNKGMVQKAGRHIFQRYISSGMLEKLIAELRMGTGIKMEKRVRGWVHPPGMRESEVPGVVTHGIDAEIVNFLGIPDLLFDLPVPKGRALKVIYDWKVNGYMSQASPRKGYILLRDGWNSGEKKHSRTHNKQHKDAHPMMHGSFVYNAGHELWDIDKDWCMQLCIYAWLGGAPVGDPIIAGIEQVCGKQPTAAESVKGFEQPWLRFARHRSVIGKDYQETLWNRCIFMWRHVTSGHIFAKLPRTESDVKCEQLMATSDAYKKDWYRKVMGR